MNQLSKDLRLRTSRISLGSTCRGATTSVICQILASRPDTIADLDSGVSGREICPLPFRKPVPAAFSAAFELHHGASAQWADRVNDGRDEARAGFSGERLDDSHISFLS
jgi:hypothetical protein